MSETPVDQATTPGFQPPVNVQFSVFLDNRVGRLLDLLECLDATALTLAGLCVVEASDHAVVRLLTSRHELAQGRLERAGLSFSQSEILVVELDGPGSMKQMTTALRTAELSIDYLYPLLVQPRGRSVIALQCDDLILAGQILRKKLFTLLGENDLGDNATGSDPLDRDPGRN